MMNHRITPLQRAAGHDAAGQPVETWPALPDIWANVKFETGAQVLRAGAETSIVRVSIRIYARPDIDETMRVRYLGREYDVKSALPDSKDRRYMFLVCEGVK